MTSRRRLVVRSRSTVYGIPQRAAAQIRVEIACAAEQQRYVLPRDRLFVVQDGAVVRQVCLASSCAACCTGVVGASTQASASQAAVTSTRRPAAPASPIRRTPRPPRTATGVERRLHTSAKCIAGPITRSTSSSTARHRAVVDCRDDVRRRPGVGQHALTSPCTRRCRRCASRRSTASGRTTRKSPGRVAVSPAERERRDDLALQRIGVWKLVDRQLIDVATHALRDVGPATSRSRPCAAARRSSRATSWQPAAKPTRAAARARAARAQQLDVDGERVAERECKRATPAASTVSTHPAPLPARLAVHLPRPHCAESLDRVLLPQAASRRAACTSAPLAKRRRARAAPLRRERRRCDRLAGRLRPEPAIRSPIARSEHLPRPRSRG